MNEELQSLAERIDRMSELVDRLAGENRELKRRLDEATAAGAGAEQKLARARTLVESALSRLPMLDGPPSVAEPESLPATH